MPIFVRHILKNNVKFEFGINSWSRTNFWCDIYSKMDLSLV